MLASLHVIESPAANSKWNYRFTKEVILSLDVLELGFFNVLRVVPSSHLEEDPIEYETELDRGASYVVGESVLYSWIRKRITPLVGIMLKRKETFMAF